MNNDTLHTNINSNGVGKTLYQEGIKIASCMPLHAGVAVAQAHAHIASPVSMPSHGYGKSFAEHITREGNVIAVKDMVDENNMLTEEAIVKLTNELHSHKIAYFDVDGLGDTEQIKEILNSILEIMPERENHLHVMNFGDDEKTTVMDEFHKLKFEAPIFPKETPSYRDLEFKNSKSNRK